MLTAIPNSYTIVTNPIYHKGLPDLLHFQQTIKVAIELKIDKAEPTLMQAHELLKLRKSGFEIFVCNQHSVDVVLEYLYLKGGIPWVRK